MRDKEKRKQLDWLQDRKRQKKKKKLVADNEASYKRSYQQRDWLIERIDANNWIGYKTERKKEKPIADNEAS